MSWPSSRLARRAVLLAVPALIAGTAAATIGASGSIAVGTVQAVERQAVENRSGASPAEIGNGLSARATAAAWPASVAARFPAAGRPDTAIAGLRSPDGTPTPTRSHSVVAAAGSNGGPRWWWLGTLIAAEVLLAALVWLPDRGKPAPESGWRRRWGKGRSTKPAQEGLKSPAAEPTRSGGSVLDFFDGDVGEDSVVLPAGAETGRVADPPATTAPPAPGPDPSLPAAPPTSAPTPAPMPASAVSAAAALASAEAQARTAGLAAAAAAAAVARYRGATRSVAPQSNGNPEARTADEGPGGHGVRT